MNALPRTAYEQETRTAERFLTAFEQGIGRESTGSKRLVRRACWRRRLNASGVYSDGGNRGGFVPRLIPFLQMEHPQICAEMIEADQINGQIRMVVRALWLCHLLSANTDLSGWTTIRRHYGAADVPPVAEVAVSALRDEDSYLWLLRYGHELAARWSQTHTAPHAGAAYLDWFSSRPTPHL